MSPHGTPGETGLKWKQAQRSQHDTDDGNGHASSEQSVHKALTCPECVCLGPFSVWRRIRKKNLSRCTCSNLVPLEMKGACTCEQQKRCGSLTLKRVPALDRQFHSSISKRNGLERTQRALPRCTLALEQIPLVLIIDSSQCHYTGSKCNC